MVEQLPYCGAGPESGTLLERVDSDPWQLSADVRSISLPQTLAGYNDATPSQSRAPLGTTTGPQ